MFVAMDESQTKIFNGLTPERNSLFMRYAIWVSINDLKKEQTFQFPIYRNNAVVSELAKYGVKIKMESIENVLEMIK